MAQRKLVYRVLSSLLLSLCIGFLILFLSQKNVQKVGVASSSVITPTEITSILKAINTERHSEVQKEPIRNYLMKRLQSYGYNVLEQSNGELVNIIAYQGELTSPYTLIGAHYDTVPGTTGMDDNASGVAALLALAKYTKDPSIRFVLFDKEEYNLSGSRYYAKSTSLPKFAVILETMGYISHSPHSQSIPPFYSILYRGLYNRQKDNEFTGDFSTAVCSKTAKAFCDQYEAEAYGRSLSVYSVYIPRISFVRNLFLDLFRSDHTPFLLKNVPVVMITDSANFRNSRYHRASDTIDTVSSDFIAEQANSILSALQARQTKK